jgi:hypothetical protein
MKLLEIVMTTNDKTRELIAKERKHKQHQDETMLTRAVEGLETHTPTDLEEKARELVTRERQESEHIEENMLTRAVEEVETDASTDID